MNTQQRPRLRLVGPGLAAALQDRSMESLLSLIPEAHRRDPRTIVGSLLAGSLTSSQTTIPEKFWIHAQAGCGIHDVTQPQRLFPSTHHPSRADAIFTAYCVDQQLGRLITEPTAPLDHLSDVASALVSGVRESARHFGQIMIEHGALLQQLVGNLEAVHSGFRRAIATLKAEIVVARAYDPAAEIDGMQQVLLHKDVRISALQREVTELLRERETLLDEAAAASTWKKARDELALVLCRHAQRNGQLVEIEEARLETLRQQMKLHPIEDDQDASDRIMSSQPVDRATQAALDAPFDSALVETIQRIGAGMMKQIETSETLCAPFYTTNGLQTLTRPATIALSRLDELTKRISQPGQLQARPSCVAPPISKAVVSSLLSGLEDAVAQITSRLAALADRNDIKKLAFPLVAPGGPNEACSLCRRIEPDPNTIRAAKELDAVNARMVQLMKSVELLHAERLVLQNELELSNARFNRNRDSCCDVDVQTEPLKKEWANHSSSSADHGKLAPIDVASSPLAHREPESRRLDKKQMSHRRLPANQPTVDGTAKLPLPTRHDSVSHTATPAKVNSIPSGHPMISIPRNGKFDSRAGRGVTSPNTFAESNAAENIEHADIQHNFPLTFTAISGALVTAEKPRARPLVWSLKHVQAIWWLSAKRVDSEDRLGIRHFVVEHFRTTNANRASAFAAAVSFVDSLQARSGEDGRVSLFRDFVDETFGNDVFRAVCRFSANLDASAATYAQPNRDGDVGRQCTLIPLAHAIMSVSETFSKDAHSFCEALIENSFVTSDPSKSLTSLEVAEFVTREWQVRVAPDFVYRKVQRHQLLLAAAKFCNGESAQRACATISEPVQVTQLWEQLEDVEVDV